MALLCLYPSWGICLFPIGDFYQNVESDSCVMSIQDVMIVCRSDGMNVLSGEVHSRHSLSDEIVLLENDVIISFIDVSPVASWAYITQLASADTAEIVTLDRGSGGMILTEILADPDPLLGDANGDGTVHSSDDEFLEWYNHSSQAIETCQECQSLMVCVSAINSQTEALSMLEKFFLSLVKVETQHWQRWFNLHQQEL